MSNLAILEPYSRKLAKAGSQAEDLLYSNPNACAGELRYIIETIARQIVKEKKLTIPSDPSAQNRQPSLHDQLVAISNARIMPKDRVDDFFKIKDIGNKIHDHSVTIEEGQDALEATYRVAVWYVRDYKRSSQPIPAFALPEPIPPRKTNVVQPTELTSLFDTPIKRWAVGLLSGLGLIWILEIYLDPKHRWQAALKKTIRIACVLALIVLVLLPIALIADKVTLWQIYSFFVGRLEEKLSWNRYIIQALVLIFLMPFLYAVPLSLSARNKHKRRVGTIILISLAVGFNLMFYYATRQIVFDKCYGVENNQIVLYDRPGLDPQTGKPLQKVTRVIMQIYELQKQGVVMAQADPNTKPWFGSIDGEPMLWYSRRSPSGELVFYNMPGNDPRTGDPLLPVTRDLFSTWSTTKASAKGSGHPDVKVPSVDSMDAFRKTLTAGAGAGAPGLLLLQHSGTDREATDALTRHLAGVNTNALHAEAMKKQGYAARLYNGDENLLREAISFTRLGSLVVADVSAECVKKSPLDADLLTCDVTANARRFDGHGTPKGTVLARGTGAGFNQADALELAAQHASSELMALAKD